jgi:hypothetical protein
MKVAVTYTEKWRRTVDVEINDDEFADWNGDEEITSTAIREYLEEEDSRWAHPDYPGSQDDDEFDHLDIEEVEIPTEAELAARS